MRPEDHQSLADLEEESMDWGKYEEATALEPSDGFLHLGKQRGWNVQCALTGADFDVWFCEAMKVASAGD